MKTESTQEELKKLLLEAKSYYGYQKEFLKITIAEQLTQVLGTIAIGFIIISMALVIFVLLGLALVHWIGEAIHNIGLCYAIFALFMGIILACIYIFRRKIIVLPLARVMTRVFLSDTSKKDNVDLHDE